MKGKKREVFFTMESQEHFLEKISPDNKKLICKYKHFESRSPALNDPAHANWKLLCVAMGRRRLALAILRPVRHHAGKLQSSAYEVRLGLRQDGVFQR